MNSRIALFIPNLAAGGVQRSLLLLVEGFLQQDLQVDLVVGRAEGPFLSQVPRGTRLVDLQVRHIRAALPGLVHYLKESPPTALLSAQTHANILALWACKLTDRKIHLVISEHNDMAAVVGAPLAGRDRLRPWFARLFYPWADAIVAVSIGVADSLASLTSLPRTSIRVIYNPLIPSDFEDRKQAPCSHPWLQPGHPKLLLAAGRLVHQKNYSCLLRSLVILRQWMDVRLLILGEGSERQVLETQVKELGVQASVELPGYVENPYAFMARASAFVLSSAWEGFPSVLIEAMACGVPVVATDCPSGPAEILEGGRFGHLVPVGDPQALAEALREVLMNPGPVEAARSRAFQFTIDRAVKEYLPLLLGS